MNSIIFNGIAASPGIGIGKVFLLEREDLVAVKRKISPSEVKKEIRRLNLALKKTKRDFRQEKEQMLRILGKNHARLADAYLLILEDPILTKDVERDIEQNLLNVEYVVQNALDRISRTFDALQDEYFRERKNDILEVGHKILQYLMGKNPSRRQELKEGSILVAHNLLPSDTVSLNTSLIRGFVIDVGGKTSHTALLAQSLGIPAVVGLKQVTSHVRSGQMMIVDGSQGIVTLEPGSKEIVKAEKEKELQERQAQELEKLKNLSAETKDHHKVELLGNVETADDVKSVEEHGACGIGLFRTEYLYMNRGNLPEEEEQYEHYLKAVKNIKSGSIVFRTLDIGGDKLAPFIQGFVKESNPFLGLRAVRFCLKYPEIFRTQLRALLRVSAYGKIKIMFPMIANVHEFLQAKEILDVVKLDLESEKIAFDKNIEVGAMIEVPSAAVTADMIAPYADFFSLGTNDLIQYTFAIDRINENVASLYDPKHLSILRLIKFVIDAAHAKGKTVSICGEMASDMIYTQILLGLGIDGFSVVPSFAPRVKEIIRNANYAHCKKTADSILKSKTHLEVHSILDKFLAS